MKQNLIFILISCFQQFFFVYSYLSYHGKSCNYFASNRKQSFVHYIDLQGSTYSPQSHFNCRTSVLYSKIESTEIKTRRVVIVGGGVGGLAVGARLASSLKKHGMTNLGSSVEKKTTWEVVLLEKNSKSMVGGRCGSFDVNIPNIGSFRHERGPSLLLLKNEYEKLFEDCIQDMNDYPDETSSSSSAACEEFGLKMEQCIPAYQVVFEDGDKLNLGFPKYSSSGEISNLQLQNMEKKSRDKMNALEEHGANKWDSYMNATSAFLDCGLPNFIEERLDLLSFPAFLKESLKDGLKAWPLKPHSEVLDATFASEKMRATASFQDLYVGLEPYKNNDVFGGGVIRKTAPAVFGLLAALELHPTNKKAGVFAPIGGFRSVGQSFQRLAEECGVKIHFNITVTQINENVIKYINKTTSIDNDDATLNISERNHMDADLIVVNADLPFSKQSLLSTMRHDKNSVVENSIPQEMFDWDDSFDFSSGVIAFHWSLSKSLNGLNTHNVFLIGLNRAQAEKSWRIIRNNPSLDPTSKNSEKISVEPFNFYVHRPVKTDPSAAPKGHDSIMVLVPCPTLTRNENYSKLPREESIRRYKSQFDDSYIDRVRTAVIKRLEVIDGLTDLRNHIIHEVVDTPGTYADFYNVGAGVPFGLSHGFNQLSVTRPGAESKEMKNLYYVGASSRPGNGVPLVLIGAKSVADNVMKRIIDAH